MKEFNLSSDIELNKRLNDEMWVKINEAGSLDDAVKEAKSDFIVKNKDEIFKAIKEDIIETIDKNTYMRKVYKDDGSFSHFEYEIYVDYQDCLSDKDMEKIIEYDGNKMDKFYEIVDEYYFDYHYDDGYDDYLKNKCLYKGYDIYDFASEMIYPTIDYNHFLKQDVKMNLITDFYNESNIEFTNNSFFCDGREYKERLGNGSMTWLINNQGYKVNDVYKAYKNGLIGNESRFVKSVVSELANATYLMNCLTFLLKMELRDIINIYDDKANVIIKSNCMCGLYNPFVGSGSMLEIKLEKDLEIPFKNIWSLGTDGAVGYSIDSIYGLAGNCWTDNYNYIVK